MRDSILPLLSYCPELHKLEHCHKVLRQHEFEKAILFVDRVVVARKLAEELEEYNPVLLLGRLRFSSEEQRQAIREARDPDAKIIISTSAGKEGMDLPTADLLIVWSNVSNAVRWVQRQGRIMRKVEGETKPKAAVYIATPGSPDYESLRMGLEAASQVGIDIIGIDEKAILSESIIHRVQTALEANPNKLESLSEGLRQPLSRVETWLKKNIAEGEVFYLYAVPEDLNEWRREAGNIIKKVKEGKLDFDIENLNHVQERIINNFSPQKKHRYYCLEDEIPVIETDFPYLVKGDGSHTLKVNFGPTWNERTKHWAYGVPKKVLKKMLERLRDEEKLYANISFRSYRPTYAFQMIYQGSATKEIMNTILRNADAVATELDRRLSYEKGMTE